MSKPRFKLGEAVRTNPKLRYMFGGIVIEIQLSTNKRKGILYRLRITSLHAIWFAEKHLRRWNRASI